MQRQELLKKLEDLHADLAGAEQVDPETRARLETLTADIERLLDQDEPSEEEVEPVSSGLNDLVLKFEADYPQLSASVGRVADALAAMGF